MNKRWMQAAGAALVGVVVAAVPSSVTADEIAAGEVVPVGESFDVADGAALGGGRYEAYGFPEIASDPVTGRSLIVYNSTQYDDVADTYEDEEIHARAVDHAGTIGPAVRIDVELGSRGFDAFEPPSVTWNGTDDEFLVVWSTDDVVYGQLVDDDGTRRGENFVIAANRTGAAAVAGIDSFHDIEHVRAAWSAEHRAYMVTFKARGHVAGVEFDQTILATLISADGEVVLAGDVVDVSTEEADNGVGIAYSEASDVFLIVWERNETADLPGARVVSIEPAGATSSIVLESEIVAVSTVGTGRGGAPDVAWDSSRDQFGVTWRGDGGGTDFQMWMNVVDPGGTIDEADALQVSDEAVSPTRARIAYSPVTREFGLTAAVSGNGGEVKTWTVAGDLAAVTSSVGIGVEGRARPHISYGGGSFRCVWWSLGAAWGNPPDPDSVHARFGCRACSTITPGSETFDDVPAGAFFDVPVGWLVETDATTGTAPGVYSPLDDLTRGQLATLLWRLAGEPAASPGSATFDDVPTGRFDDLPIGWLLAEGLTTGTSDTTYDPDRPITRGELATFIWRLAGQPAGDPGSATFSDVGVGRFFDLPIGWMFDRGITTGTSPTTFDPDRPVTRGEAATFLFRYYGIVDCASLEA